MEIILVMKNLRDEGVVMVIRGSKWGGEGDGWFLFLRFACVEEREWYNFLENEKMWSVGGLDGSDGFEVFPRVDLFYFIVKLISIKCVYD